LPRNRLVNPLDSIPTAAIQKISKRSFLPPHLFGAILLLLLAATWVFKIAFSKPVKKDYRGGFQDHEGIWTDSVDGGSDAFIQLHLTIIGCTLTLKSVGAALNR
jgi:hypothetical protein